MIGRAEASELMRLVGGGDYAQEAAVVASLIREYKPDATSILDVACGTGGHIGFWLKEFNCAGIDLDPEMLELARTKYPQADFYTADMRTFDLGRVFDAATCLCSLAFSIEDLSRTVKQMAAHLAVGGVLVLDGWIRPEEWRDPEPVQMVHGTVNGFSVQTMARLARRDRYSELDWECLVADSDGISHFAFRYDAMVFTNDEYMTALETSGITAHVVPGMLPRRDRYVGIKRGTSSAPE